MALRLKIYDDVTIRENGKWVKITHAGHGLWRISFGWDGQIKAIRSQQGPNETWARLRAKAWLQDN